MATTTKKSVFKDTVSKGYQKTKDYGRKYKSDVSEAYDIGYARGWDDAYDVPERFGARIAAAYGYRKGIKHRRKTDKYTKQYARKGKKNLQ